MAKRKRRRKTSAQPRESSGRRSLSFPLDLSAVGLWLLLFLPAFTLFPGIAESFRLPKLVVSEVLALVACALLVLRLSSSRREAPLRPLAWLRSPVVVATLPLVLVAALGAMFSEHDAFVARTLPIFLSGVLFLWTVTACVGAPERRRWIQVWTIPAALLAVIGLIQALDLWEPLAFRGLVSDRLAVTSLAGGAFDLAAYLLLPALLVQEQVRRTRGRRRILWAAAGLVIFAALVSTQTLAVLAAFLFGSVVLWWQSLPRRRAMQAAAAMVVLVLVTIALVGPLRSRALRVAEFLGEGEINSVLTGRMDGWRAALWMAGEEPWTGVGIGAYRAEFGEARIALQDEGVRFFPRHTQPYFVNAHNDVLEALAEWGWPGLLALLWGGWVVSRRLRGSLPGWRVEGRRSKPLLGAFVVAIVTVTLTNFPFHLALIAFPWLVVLAGVFDEDGEDPRASDPPGDDDSAGPALPTRPAGLVLALAFLLLAGWAFQRGKDRVGAQILTRKAESVVLQGVSLGRMPPKAVQVTLEMLRRARQLDPAQVSIPVTRGGLYLSMQRWAAAERAYGEALELEYRAEIWTNLARVHLGAGDREKALEAGRIAVRLHPKKAKELIALPELRRLAKEVRLGEPAIDSSRENAETAEPGETAEPDEAGR